MYSSSSSSFFFPPPAVLSRLYCILPYPCIWEYGLQLLSVSVHLDFLLGLAADMSVCFCADRWAVLCDLYLYIIGVPHPPRVLWCFVEFRCTELTSFDEKCQCKKNLNGSFLFFPDYLCPSLFCKVMFFNIIVSVKKDRSLWNKLYVRFCRIFASPF